MLRLSDPVQGDRDPAAFDDLGDATTFPVTVACTGPAGAPDVTRNVTISRDGTATVVSGLNTGSVCTITETNTDGATVTISPNPVTIGNATTVAVTITNTYATNAIGSLTLSKQIVDPDPSDSKGDAQTFPVTVACTGPGNSPEVTTQVELDRDGTPVTIDGLYLGSVCTITETETDGGSISYNPGDTVTIGDQSAVTVTVTNTYPAAPAILPMTGTDAALRVLRGLVLILAGGAVTFTTRRRSESISE